MQLTGALPSPITEEDHRRDFHKSALFGATVPANGSIDLTASHTWRIQGAESCVAYTHAQQVQDLAAIRGEPLPLLSAAWLYARGRIRNGQLVAGVGLPDAGTNCAAVLAEARDAGILAEADYPDIAINIGRVPPANAWATRPLVKVTGEHRIIFEGLADAEDRLRSGIRAAMSAAEAKTSSKPCGCMIVDDAYGALPIGSVYSASGGNVWGSHCQVVNEYREDLDAIGFGTTWPGPQRNFYVSIPWFAKNGAAVFLIDSYARAA